MKIVVDESFYHVYKGIIGKGDNAMNLDQFKLWLYKATDSEIESAKNEIRDKLNRARKPEIKLGYELAIQEIVIQQELRARFPITPEIEAMTLEEVFAELDVELAKI